MHTQNFLQLKEDAGPTEFFPRPKNETKLKRPERWETSVSLLLASYTPLPRSYDGCGFHPDPADDQKFLRSLTSISPHTKAKPKKI